MQVYITCMLSVVHLGTYWLSSYVKLQLHSSWLRARLHSNMLERNRKTHWKHLFWQHLVRSVQIDELHDSSCQHRGGSSGGGRSPSSYYHTICLCVITTLVLQCCCALRIQASLHDQCFCVLIMKTRRDGRTQQTNVFQYSINKTHINT